jgi:hypothetical protein
VNETNGEETRIVSSTSKVAILQLFRTSAMNAPKWNRDWLPEPVYEQYAAKIVKCT